MEMIIFIGLQASGKTAFFRAYFMTTHELISKDRFRNNKNRNRRQAQLIEAAFQAGRSVVVDNTNPTIADRQSLIHLGRMYGAEIVGYFFESRLNECLERNRHRPGKARVPDIAIYATAKKLVQPSYREGFERLFSVRITSNATFEIREWIEGDGP
jgi:predicted kinase